MVVEMILKISIPLIDMRHLYILLAITVLLSACATTSETEGVVEILEPNEDWDFPEAEQIVCRFNTILEVSSETQEDGSEKVSYSIDEQSEPIEIRFGFDSEGKAIVYGNAGESELIVSKNDTEGIVLIERSAFNYVFTYTIFRDRGIGYWTKTNEIFGSSYSFISVGRCWGQA